ncbi:MAG: hypothetical protein DRH70_00870, partial [Candidatus Coatesbacteria bacterium]
MNEIITCIENLRLKLEKFSKSRISEAETKVAFINPLLRSLGWDPADQDEVRLEYLIFAGKFVDYALKINQEVRLFIEAKPLQNPLRDEKPIGQVISYAATAGVKWCILTNGIVYKVFCTTEKGPAPEKLLYEV